MIKFIPNYSLLPLQMSSDFPQDMRNMRLCTWETEQTSLLPAASFMSELSNVGKLE
jgi:hypothetical protein